MGLAVAFAGRPHGAAASLVSIPWDECAWSCDLADDLVAPPQPASRFVLSLWRHGGLDLDGKPQSPPEPPAGGAPPPIGPRGELTFAGEDTPPYLAPHPTAPSLVLVGHLLYSPSAQPDDLTSTISDLNTFFQSPPPPRPPPSETPEGTGDETDQ